MRVSRWLMPIVVIATILVAAPVAQAAGWWSTSGRTQVVEQSLKVEDLKGWMTIQQAADGLGVPAEVLIRGIGADPSELPASTAFKDVEAKVPGFELSSFREVLPEVLAQASGAASSSSGAAPGPSTTPR